ncbi:MAG: shikimate kinase, partial [Bacteroidota bacterium]
MKIFLVGFMGCGKSYVGKHLAPLMDFAFLDMDQFIEQREQATISEIFERGGEEHFRQIERQALEATADMDRFIIGTGGGAPCFYDNMEWMNQHGMTVYLKTPVEVLFERLARKRSHRPLVAQLSDDELRQFISRKLEERAPFYEQAQLVYERFTDKKLAEIPRQIPYSILFIQIE